MIPNRGSQVLTQRHKKQNRGQEASKVSPEVIHRTGLKKSRDELFDEALSLAKIGKYEDAIENINRLSEDAPSFVKAQPLKASILINLERVEEAKGICLKILETDQWCLESTLLLGMIAKIRNEEDQALKRFREALYIQSSCWQAHFYLGEIYRSRGKLEQARREYDIVLKLLKNEDTCGNRLALFPLSSAPELVINICRHNLSELKRRVKG